MTLPSTTSLEDAIRHAGEGWLIDMYAPPQDAVPHLCNLLDTVTQRGRELLGADAPDLNEAALVDLYNRYPRKVKAFFQALGGTRAPDMLLMAWRIIQGMEIKEVQLTYRRQDHFHVRVVLESPYGAQDEPYESDVIGDFALFRHIGIMEIGQKPVFDGFYPLLVR